MSNLPPGCTPRMIEELMYPKQSEEDMALKEELFGALDAVGDNDLPDGAWWQVLEDTVTYFNKAHGTNYDSNTMAHAWVESRGEKQ